MITVTGATGRLGRLVVERLLERVPADQVRAVVRDPEKAADFAGRGVDIRVADYNRPATLRGALGGTDRLLLISSNEPARSLAQHAAVISAARQVGVGFLAYTSLVADIAAPRASEPTVVESGLPFTLLRNNLYTGHFAPQIKQAVGMGYLIGSAGDGRAASATHEDYAAAAVAVLTGEGHEGKTYELTGDVAWSFRDLVNEISAAAGKAIGYRSVSTATHRERLLAAGMPRQYTDVVVQSHAAIATGRLATATPDLRDLIGRPTTTLAEFVTKTVNS